MEHPLITIIIPTYNSEQTIDECIKSIASQTYKNIEVIAIDGLSTDKTVPKLKDYSAFHHYISIVSEADKGIYDAMNKGINLAKGDWIYFLGSDDSFFNETVLERVAGVIKDSQYLQVLYGKVFSDRFNGEYGEPFDRNKILRNNICHQAIFFRKDVFQLTGTFDLKYTSQADWDHNLKWMLNTAIQNKYVDIVIANYADGGFSSLKGDDVFYRDLPLNYIKYGHTTLSGKKMLSILVYQFLKSIKRFDFQKMKSVLQHFRYLKK